MVLIQSIPFNRAYFICVHVRSLKNNKNWQEKLKVKKKKRSENCCFLPIKSSEPKKKDHKFIFIFLLLKKIYNKKSIKHTMGRRINRVTEIKYPSRVEGWLDVCGKFLLLS